MEKFLKLSLIAISAIFFITGCAEKSPEAKNNKKIKTEIQHESHAKHWGYSGDVGPTNWGKLNPKFHMCSEGKQQCPINVVPTKDVNLPPLDLKYTKSSKNIIDNGHAVQVNMQKGNIFVIDGVPYELKQFHFHTPSENHIKGKSFPMEAHFVHASKDGKLAVIAVMFVEGAANPTLGKIEKEFPLEHNKAKDLTFSQEYLNVMLPENKDYYKFMGSLTTPPCSEDVKWFVLKTPITASKKQIEAMHKQINKENNRPIQPTNGREILE
jgi:carbonic anhydrase